MLRVLACLVVAGCVAQGRGDEATPPAADFTENIPEGGLPSTTRKVFWLKPGQVLKVVDEEGKAEFEPVPKTNGGVGASANDTFDPTKQDSLNAIAYAFKNGACDFNATINYKDEFKKLGSYTTPLWEKKQAGRAQLVTAVSTNYTFTNPPAEVLDGVVSFCVRFKSSAAKGSSLRSVQEEVHSGDKTTYLEVVIHSSAAGLTAKILGILAFTAAGVGKAIRI